MRDKRKLFLPLTIIGILAVLIIFLFLKYSSSTKKQEKGQNLDKLRVQAGWVLNGEFANVCSAIVNGYYEDEGLEVELIPGGPTGASFVIATNAIVQDNSLDLAIDGDLVPLLRGLTQEDKDERLKVKAFASFWNEIPLGFIVREESGIKSLKDLAGRKTNGEKYKIGVTADFVLQKAMAEYAGVSVDDLEFVTVGFDAAPFLLGEVDALAAYWTTQAYEVEKAGVAYKFLSISELPGFSQPSMVALATEKVISEKKDQLVRWLRATRKGVSFVVQNPEQAAEHILDDRCGGKGFDKEQELWLIKKSIPLFGDSNIGKLDKDQITGFAEAFNKLGQISFVPDSNTYLDYEIFDLSIK